jgi:hypothetical protein
MFRPFFASAAVTGLGVAVAFGVGSRAPVQAQVPNPLCLASAPTLLQFTELEPNSPAFVDDLTVQGITFDYKLDGLDSTDSSYGSLDGPGTTQYVDGATLEGHSRGVLTMQFATPVASLSFGFAVSTLATVPGALIVDLYGRGDVLLQQVVVDAVSTGFVGEGFFSYSDAHVTRAVITFAPFVSNIGLNRFAIDNLGFQPNLISTQFTDPALPAGWAMALWSPGGTASIANGILSLNGSRVGTSDVYAGPRTLEFVATFTSSAWQHVGFASKDFTGHGNWIIFSTYTGGRLLARTGTGARNIHTSLGSGPLWEPHVYRIEWTATATRFYIDGVLVATHLVSFGPTARVLASDYSSGGGTLRVDEVWLTPDTAPGCGTPQAF